MELGMMLGVGRGRKQVLPIINGRVLNGYKQTDRIATLTVCNEPCC